VGWGGVGGVVVGGGVVGVVVGGVGVVVWSEEHRVSERDSADARNALMAPSR
jgi:hypothetical protein